MINKKLLKILFAVCGLSILVCIVVGIFTRKSYVDDIEQRQYMNGGYRIESIPLGSDDVYEDERIRSFEELENQAEVIVRVRVNKDERREFNMNLTITNVEVVEVYKGDVEEENIYVIEPIYYYSEGDYIFSQLYYWMNEEDEYILYLDKIKDMHLGKQEYIYNPTTLHLSKYNTDKDDDIVNTPGYYYRYYEFRQNVMDKYSTD